MDYPNATGKTLHDLMVSKKWTEEETCAFMDIPFTTGHGRIQRHKKRLDDKQKLASLDYDLFEVDLGEPLTLSGDWIVVGDVQLPTTDIDFAMLPALVAERYLTAPRRLLIAGDLLNMDFVSKYDRD